LNWSGEQLRILRELGHEPMRLASAAPPDAPVGAAFSRDLEPRVEAQSRPKAAPTGEALAAAIVRAAGGSDLSALALDFDRLRREPALKRALWPKLRALRRGH
jgi:hypothetical protein